MKTLTLAAIGLTLAASILVPFAFELGASILFATGVIGIAVFDYTRTSRRLRLPLAAPVVVQRRERFGLAA